MNNPRDKHKPDNESAPENCISTVLSDKSSKNLSKSTKSSSKDQQLQADKQVSNPEARDEDDAAERKNRKGQFQRGQSGNPAGRPKGALNRSTLAARAILEQNGSRLMAAAVKLATAGNPIALKLCLERLVPLAHDRAVNLTLPPNPSNPTEICASHNAVLRAVADGTITPSEGRHLAAIVDSHRRSWESTELADRMTDLESRLPKRK